MQFFVIGLLALTSFAFAKHISPEISPIYGYIEKYGIPEAERIRKVEEDYLSSRIIGGVPAAHGQYPFQVGLLGEVVGLEGYTVCGGSLVSAHRVITAAHCWYDGTHQVWRLTAVLGSTFLFSGGTRVQTSAIAVHPNFNVFLARNDVAVVYFSETINFSDTIAPISLPSGNAMFENYAGEPAIAIGFGLTATDGSISGELNHVRLNVIDNSICRISYPLIIQSSNICTSGLGTNICRGDSGGPLITTRDNRPVLIGVSSFVSSVGCEAGLPAAYARATAFMDFFTSHM